MNESSKSIFHKLKDSRYATRYIIGDGIDIGSGNDSLALYYEFFPLMSSCKGWDLPDGDAQALATIENSTFDFVHSSHCLEHMKDPHLALHNWLRILKPGGHLICLVPDEDLYEQGVFPSTFNPDHKHTFTIHKRNSWSPNSINVTGMLSAVKSNIEILKIELLNATYRYKISRLTSQNRFDQTLTPVGESAIEFVIKKIN